MALVHYQFYDHLSRPVGLCGRIGILSDHGPNVTCGHCQRELALRGWFPKFKYHFQKDDGEILCTCTKTSIARRRKTLTKDQDKVDCKVCRRLLGMGRGAQKLTRWDRIGDNDSLFGGGV